MGFIVISVLHATFEYGARACILTYVTLEFGSLWALIMAVEGGVRLGLWLGTTWVANVVLVGRTRNGAWWGSAMLTGVAGLGNVLASFDFPMFAAAEASDPRTIARGRLYRSLRKVYVCASYLLYLGEGGFALFCCVYYGGATRWALLVPSGVSLAGFAVMHPVEAWARGIGLCGRSKRDMLEDHAAGLAGAGSSGGGGGGGGGGGRIPPRDLITKAQDAMEAAAMVGATEVVPSHAADEHTGLMMGSLFAVGEVAKVDSNRDTLVRYVVVVPLLPGIPRLTPG